MKCSCFKCNKSFETGLKYECEFPKRPLCDNCKNKLSKLKKLEDKWDFLKEKYL